MAKRQEMREGAADVEGVADRQAAQQVFQLPEVVLTAGARVLRQVPHPLDGVEQPLADLLAQGIAQHGAKVVDVTPQRGMRVGVRRGR